MKKIISFCLYGKSRIYQEGAVKNSELAKEIYPDWTARFYVGEGVSGRTKKRLLSNGSEVIEFKTEEGMNPMLTRLLPFADPEVEFWISRDCDSRLSWKEKSAVDEWLESGKTFHVMRDSHNHYYAIPGGMFGVSNFRLRNKIGYSISVNLFYSAGDDQHYLEKNLWSIFCRDLLCHDTWSHNIPNTKTLTERKGDKISWKKAYGVGLDVFLTDQKNRIFSHILSTEGQINKDFPPHKEMEFGVFIGQKIDEKDRPVMSRDVRWEYEIRGISCE